MKKGIYTLLSLLLVVGILTAPLTGGMMVDAKTIEEQLADQLLDSLIGGVDEPVEAEPWTAAGPGTLIVRMEDEPLVTYMRESQSLNTFLRSFAAQSREESLLQAQESVELQVLAEVDSAAEVTYHYTSVFNGFAMEVADMACGQEIRSLPGVSDVFVSEEVPLLEPVGETASVEVAVQELTAAGYTGKGQAIAIIDTELAVGHDYFATAPEGTVKHTEQSIANALSGLSISGGSIAAENVYKSAKIPFAYDYGERDSDVSYNQNKRSPAHGTHVTGIVAGKNGTASNETLNGVASDAQIVFMKATNGEYFMSDAILAAINDAVKLGVCAINMSFGSDYGKKSTDIYYGEALTNAKKAGIFLSCANGNAHMGYQPKKENGILTNPISTKNMEYSAMGTPANQDSTVAIAALNTTGSATDPLAYFTSWGLAEDLTLKPELSAPGYQILSSAPGNNSSYSLSSGTSMAAPYVTGVAALLSEWYEEKKGEGSVPDEAMLTKASLNRASYFEALLASTAKIQTGDGKAKAENNTYQSPRRQGSGAVSFEAAVTAPAVLLGDDGDEDSLPDKSRISLGELEEKDTFSIQAVLQPFSSSVPEYDVSLFVTTDSYTTKDNAYYVQANQPTSLTAELIREEWGAADANGARQLRLTVKLNQDELAANKLIFPNGFYIDGYVILTPKTGGTPALHIPFTGFYGSWMASPIFDESVYSQDSLMSVLAPLGTVKTDSGNAYIPLGRCFFTGKPTSEDLDYLTISPGTPDEYFDALGIGWGLLRTVSSAKIALKNGEDTVISGYFRENNYDKKYLPQYFSLGGMWSPTLKKLAEGIYNLELSAWHSTNTNTSDKPDDESSFSIVVDNTAPAFSNASVVTERNTATLKVTASDTYGLGLSALIEVKGGDMANATTVYTLNHTGKEEALEFDITARSTQELYLCTYDCGLNSKVVSVAELLAATPTPTPAPVPVGPPVTEPSIEPSTEPSEEPTPVPPAFKDVDYSSWYGDAVSYVVEKGLFNGTDIDLFSPHAPMNRGMIATVLYRMAGEPAVSGTDTGFSDVPSQAYYARAVRWAKENNVMNGTGAGFSPNGTLTREQLATVLYRFSGSPEVSGDLSAFRDGSTAGKYAEKALVWCVQQGILGGMGDNLLNPKGEALRSQVSVMLWRFLEPESSGVV